MPFTLSEIVKNMVSLIIGFKQHRVHFYLKFCLGLFFFVLGLLLFLAIKMRDFKKEKIQGKSSVAFQTLKEKKKFRGKEDRKEWNARVLPKLEDKAQMILFKMSIYHFVSI